MKTTADQDYLNRRCECTKHSYGQCVNPLTPKQLAFSLKKWKKRICFACQRHFDQKPQSENQPF